MVERNKWNGIKRRKRKKNKKIYVKTVIEWEKWEKK